MTDDRIGLYVIRERDEGQANRLETRASNSLGNRANNSLAPEGPRLTLAHRCESVIEDEPVTRCGRRLRHRRGTHFAYAAVPAVRICKGCD